MILFALSCLGLLLIIKDIFACKEKRSMYLSLLLLYVPYFFYVITLYLGISIIFIPDLVPKTFDWNLFNVRYGIVMVPAIIIFVSLLFNKVKFWGKIAVICLVAFQLWLFISNGYPITLKDGLIGLSARRPAPANDFIRTHYDYGYIMFDDFARVANPIELGIPMNKIIYIGNHPYWENGIKSPRTIRWFVMREDENDALWTVLGKNENFLKYFKIVYKNNKTVVFESKEK